MNRTPVMLALAGALFLGAFSNAGAAPRISRIVNNASYIPDGVPGSGIGLGSIFAIFGEEMGPAQLKLADYPLPTSFEGTSLRISVGGAEVSAFLVYTSATQVAAILPSNAAPGRAVARLTYNGQTSEPFAFTIVRNGPGLFTLNSAGSGPAVLTDANFAVLTWTKPAQPGQAVIAWATGVNPLGSPDNERPPAFDPQLAVEIFVGGKLANVRYRGRAPGFAGLDQLVFDIPDGVSGCSVSLVVRVGGNTSNFTTIPVAAPGKTVCSDANGFNESELSSIPAGGVRFGSINFTRSRSKLTVPVVGSVESTNDIASASFYRLEGALFERSQGLAQASFGSCSVYTFQGESSSGDPIRVIPLDAGVSLTLTGSGGSRTMNKQNDGYFAMLGSETSIPGGLPGGGLPGGGLPGGGQPLFLNPGEITVTGPGGRDIGAFTARIVLPPAFNWTNQDSITEVQRAQDLTITWNGGNPSQDFVIVSGASIRRNPTAGASFVCVGPSSAGRLVVPSIVLSALPASEVVQGTATGSLFVFNGPLSNVNRFTASGLDIGFITYGNSSLKSLAYQ
ncbi:MAG: hypothetical protein R2762_11920 [Bryobacteraceae bacterium]